MVELVHVIFFTFYLYFNITALTCPSKPCLVSHINVIFIELENVFVLDMLTFLE